MTKPVYCPNCHSLAVKAGKQRYVSGSKIIVHQRFKCKNKFCQHHFIKKRK